MTTGWASTNRIRTGSSDGAWGELPILRLPAKVAVAATNHHQAALAVASHLDQQGELLIASAARFDAELTRGLRADGFTVISDLGTAHQRMDPPDHGTADEPGAVWLLTSGSTGRPKRVRHTLDSLTTVTSEQPPRRWLCPYAPGSYAWWQVITLGLHHPGNDVICVEGDEVSGWPRMATSNAVTAISGTPTFWRDAIWREGPAVAAIPLEQVTVGGEPVDQQLLDTLQRLHPTARISWIYASSEAGAAIAVHDGRAGFPESWLERGLPGRPFISILDGELVLNSPFAAAGNAESIRTGDRVEIADGRVRIVGRIGTDEINVGGSKASAGVVRDVLLSHPAVAWAATRGRTAPIVGQVVVADVVLHGPVDEISLKAWCAKVLPEYAIPRRITVLPEIPLKESMKSDV